MLKEEMEKQLGVKVTNAFYVTANGMYVQGPYRNNREFCELLKHDKLLMLSLRESARMKAKLQECIMENSEDYFNFMREQRMKAKLQECIMENSED